MENTEVLKEIDKKIKMCQENINIKSKKETETIILEIRKLIEQYKAEGNIEKRIKENRMLDVINLINVSQSSEEEKQKTQNTFYGRVEMIDLADCEKWIKKNEEDWQSKIASIKAFVKKFPFKDNAIKRLDINEYVIGTGKETFCWYLENGTPGEMGQRSSLDYYMYWSAEDNSFAIREGVHKEVIQLNEAKNVFNVLKVNLENILKLADAGSVELIDEDRHGLELPKANVLQKILFLYFPEKFIGYYSRAYVEKIAAMLGINISADVYQTNHIIAERVSVKITNPKLSRIDKTVGFTIYLWRKWNDYIKKSVG